MATGKERRTTIKPMKLMMTVASLLDMLLQRPRLVVLFAIKNEFAWHNTRGGLVVESVHSATMVLASISR